MSDSMAAEAPPVPWWAVLLQGIFGVFIGLLLLGAGDITKTQGLLLVVQILGWYWFFVGIMNIVLIFVDPVMWGWKLFIGIVGILAGIAIIEYPVYSALIVPYVFVILIGIEGIVIGIADIVRGFQGGGWGIGLLGLLSLFLGGWLIAERYAATLAFPWVAGVFALVLGTAGIFMSFQVRRQQVLHGHGGPGVPAT